MDGLTERQKEVLDFIRQNIEKIGYPPTTKEIALAFGFRSLTAAKQHVALLEKKGFISVKPNTARGIRVLHAS